MIKRKIGLEGVKIACENIRFSSLFAAGNVSRETSPAAKSEEKRLFSQARVKKNEGLTSPSLPEVKKCVASGCYVVT